eukprot:COSAG01_NODE_10822_length_2072_cov_4.041033_1_plen_54_part_10
MHGASIGIRNTATLLKSTLTGLRADRSRLRPPRPPLHARSASAPLARYNRELAR